jgi:hypothetical protein
MWLELSLIIGVVSVIAIFFSWQLLSEKLKAMDARIEVLENKLGIAPEENEFNETT